MKWALLFCVLSLGHGIERPEIIKTFVSEGECIELRDEKREVATAITRALGEENSPRVYIDCIPYTGPWKKES